MYKSKNVDKPAIMWTVMKVAVIYFKLWQYFPTVKIIGYNQLIRFGPMEKKETKFGIKNSSPKAAHMGGSKTEPPIIFKSLPSPFGIKIGPPTLNLIGRGTGNNLFGRFFDKFSVLSPVCT